MTANNVGMWSRGVEKGAEVFEKTWRRVELRNPTCTWSAFRNVLAERVIACYVAD